MTDQQCVLDSRKMRQQEPMPELGAFLTRWVVTTGWYAARIAKAYREDGDALIVVEGRSVDGHPVAQALAARVVPGHARFVDLPPRRLT